MCAEKRLNVPASGAVGRAAVGADERRAPSGSPTRMKTYPAPLAKMPVVRLGADSAWMFGSGSATLDGTGEAPPSAVMAVDEEAARAVERHAGDRRETASERACRR